MRVCILQVFALDFKRVQTLDANFSLLKSLSFLTQVLSELTFLCQKSADMKTCLLKWNVAQQILALVAIFDSRLTNLIHLHFQIVDFLVKII